MNRYVLCRLFLQTDRAAMLDEIVDYVKFLRLQVKVILCAGSYILLIPLSQMEASEN